MRCSANNFVRNERIIALYQTGLSLILVGREMGVSKHVVAGVVHRAGIYRSEERARKPSRSKKPCIACKAMIRADRNKSGLCGKCFRAQGLKTSAGRPPQSSDWPRGKAKRCPLPGIPPALYGRFSYCDLETIMAAQMREAGL